MMGSPMRSLALFTVSLVCLGCGRLPDAREAAVHVDVSYDFNAGCIVVVARDKAAPDKEGRDQEEVFDREPREANFAVFRREDWGRTLEIFVSARERDCNGPEVARHVREYTLDKAGKQMLEVTLSAPDQDDDGYVATSGGGTDCDDRHAESHPGESEICDGLDNDCLGGVDDGLPQHDFLRDADGDGFGVQADVARGLRGRDRELRLR
jgi:hypothetical protein